MFLDSTIVVPHSVTRASKQTFDPLELKTMPVRMCAWVRYVPLWEHGS
jgi:hypothetical protein